MSTIKFIPDPDPFFTHCIVNGRKVYTRGFKHVGISPDCDNEFVGTLDTGDTFTIYGGTKGGGGRTDWWFAMDNMLIKCKSLKECLLIPSEM